MKTKKRGILVLLFALIVHLSFAQQKTISGTVTDQDGLPLPGVNILVKGTQNGTQTGFDGDYTITGNAGQVLIYTYLGQKETTRTIGSKNVLNVQMEEDAESLTEVIITAYGTSTKDAFTGSADVVSAEKLEYRTLTSPLSALEGNSTGVQILSASGQPGSSPTVVIRGVGTLNSSSEPLIIIDGSQFLGQLSDVNQDDIQSLTVLKDAASTALYGSRAANGVIVITTKKGKIGAPVKVSYSTQYSVVTNAIKNYEATNPSQYYELMWEGYKNTLGGANPEIEASNSIFNRLGYNPFNVADDQIVGTDGKINPNAELIYQGLDWYDKLERVGSRKNHSLNVSAGGENHQVFFSVGYLEQEGYVIESDFDRLTTRLNADLTATDWLKIGGSVNLALTNSHGLNGVGTTSIVNPFAFAKNLGPIYPVYVVNSSGQFDLDANGQPQYDLGEGYSEFGIQSRPISLGRHAIAEAILNEEVNKDNSLGLRFYADFTLLEGLHMKFNYAQDTQDDINKSYENNIVGDGAPTGRYGETRSRRTTENINQLILYNKSFGSHNFDATLGHETFTIAYSENNALANTQTAEGIYEFDNFSVISSLGGFSRASNLESYFGRLNYNYDNKYFLSGSIRSDGSSSFDSDVRWGNFVSVGGAWLVSNENFMSNVSFVDRLKLRGSYGQVGNSSLSPDLNNPDYYPSQARYTILPNAGTPGIFWSNLGNELLTWESINSWDVALEFSLFNNFIDGSVEYYNKESKELLYNLPIPFSNGLNEKPDNIGAISNEGFELGLTAHLVNTTNFSWDLNLLASTSKNEITELPDPFVNGSKRWEIGRSRYDFYLYHSAGVDPANGDALYYMFEDDASGENRIPVLNADGTQTTTNDWEAAGRAYTDDSTVPDLIGSVSNRFTYKGISLDFLVTYATGGKVLDNGYSAMMHAGDYGSSLHVDALNAWRAPGDITDVPRLENGSVNQDQTQTTRFLTDASYLALKNVNLSYTFNPDFTNRIGIENLRFTLTGENLYLKSARDGLNPQFSLAGTSAGNSYNPSRIISLGLNVSF